MATPTPRYYTLSNCGDDLGQASDNHDYVRFSMSEYTDFETFTDYSIFDGDEHIYEPWDCLEKHIPSSYAERTIRTRRETRTANSAFWPTTLRSRWTTNQDE